MKPGHLLLSPLLFCFLSFQACEQSTPQRSMLIAGDSKIELELALRPEQWQKGLMHREALPKNRGMLFVGKKEKLRHFWMKNTYIPLDIIFLNKDLKIIHIETNTTPLSETTISSRKPAQFVLEVAAGEAKRLGLEKGESINLQPEIDIGLSEVD